MRKYLILLIFSVIAFGLHAADIVYKMKQCEGFSVWYKIEKEDPRKNDSIYEVKVIMRLKPDYTNDFGKAHYIDSVMTNNISYLSFQNEKNIFLVHNMDTVRPAVYLYEGDYGLHQEYKIIVAFNVPKAALNTKSAIIIDERLFYKNLITQELY